MALAWLGARLARGPRLFLGLVRKWIKADIDDIRVDYRYRRWQWESDIRIDLGERAVAVARADFHRNPVELGQNGLGVRTFMHDSNAHRHLDLAGTAGGAVDDAAFDADLHRHRSRRDVALARRARDRALIFEIERVRFAVGIGLGADHQRGGT